MVAGRAAVAARAVLRRAVTARRRSEPSESPSERTMRLGTQPVVKANESKNGASSGSVKDASPAPVKICW